MKETTKICRHCGSRYLVGLTSLKIKICADCKKETPWFLEPGQPPIFDGTKEDPDHANNPGT